MLKKLDRGASEIEQVEAFNALVDAVNELQNMQVQVNDHEIRLTALDDPTGLTPADPYEEQRKWIGKLCWFWNRNDKCCGILTAVFDNNKYGEDDQTEEYPFQRDSVGCWQHCEPVKPDDDIIFNGE